VVQSAKGRERRLDKREKKGSEGRSREREVKSVSVTAEDPITAASERRGGGGSRALPSASMGQGTSVSDLAAGLSLVNLEDVRSRVEDQVVSQLARASLMSMLIKQHKAEEVEKRTSPTISSPVRQDRPHAASAPRKGSLSLSSPLSGSMTSTGSGHGGSQPSSRSSSRGKGGQEYGSTAKSGVPTRDPRPSAASSSSVGADAEEIAQPQLSEMERLEGRYGSALKKVSDTSMFRPGRRYVKGRCI
jgi:hypothetical protein